MYSHIQKPYGIPAPLMSRYLMLRQNSNDLQNLLDMKSPANDLTLQILVVPAGETEVSELDFEAVLCGCLLVKVEPEAYMAYPNLFNAGEKVLSAPNTWLGLQDILEEALRVSRAHC